MPEKLPENVTEWSDDQLIFAYNDKCPQCGREKDKTNTDYVSRCATCDIFWDKECATDEMLKRIVKRHKEAKIVVVSSGPVSFDEFRDAFRALMDRAYSYGIHTVLILEKLDPIKEEHQYEYGFKGGPSVSIGMIERMKDGLLKQDYNKDDRQT
jgi:hypothetical protein